MKKVFVHWKTTVAGAIAGLVMVGHGIIAGNPIMIISGIGVAIQGALSADAHKVSTPRVKK